MQLHFSAAILLVTLNVVAVKALLPITVVNQCSESIELVDNNVVETVVPGGTTIRTLSQGSSGTLRNGINTQATLAEFSMVDAVLMYGINIIPIGVIDPNCCGSLEECKAVTGTTRYNTPMQISPLGCTTVTCLEDGCMDAYHFPQDDTKAHKCMDTTSVVVTFCPGGSEGLMQQQQQQYAPLPTFDAPTPDPTQLPSAYTPTMEASPPVPTIEALTQEALMQMPMEASIPTIDPSKSDTGTVAETPTITPYTPAGSKVKSCDDHEPATESPEMESKTDTSVSKTATAGTAVESTPTTTAAPIVDAKLTSTDSKYETGTKTATSAPKTQVVSPLSLTTKEESPQTANTQSGTDKGSGASAYVGSGLGLLAVVAIVAVVVVARKKKEEVGEAEKDDVMTPVTQINVL